MKVRNIIGEIKEMLKNKRRVKFLRTKAQNVRMYFKHSHQ